MSSGLWTSSGLPIGLGSASSEKDSVVTEGFESDSTEASRLGSVVGVSTGGVTSFSGITDTTTGAFGGKLSEIINTGLSIFVGVACVDDCISEPASVSGIARGVRLLQSPVVPRRFATKSRAIEK